MGDPGDYVTGRWLDTG